MINSTDLKQLIIDALSPDYLGKYNGDSHAISILPHANFGYNFPPSDWTITGIESVIIKPIVRVKLSHEGGLKRRQWDLYLKQWSQNGLFNNAVESMVDKLLDNGYQIESPVYVPYNEKMGIIASARIPIYEFIQRIV